MDKDFIENKITQIQEKFLKDRDEKLLKVCHEIIDNNLPYRIFEFENLENYTPKFSQYEKDGQPMLKIDFQPNNNPIHVYKITREQAKSIIDEHNLR